MNSKMCLVFLFFVLCMIQIFPAQSMQNTQKKEIDENIIIGHRTQIFSKILGEWRPLEIYLPDNFESSDGSYPLMLVLDGDWAFRYCVSIVDMISPNYLPQMIVVGIPNTDRRRDLDPCRTSDPQAIKDSEKFICFLKKELFVHLEKKYRIHEYRILVGHSLAGFFTAYILLKDPAMFSAFIASSPVLQNEERLQFLSDRLDEIPGELLSHKYLYFSGGGNEPEELHEGIRKFDALLHNKENLGLKWDSDIFEGEGHVPIKGFYQGLMNLFSGWIPELEFFRSGTLDFIKKHYETLTKRFGFKVLPPPDILNTVGQRYLGNNESQQSVELYTYFVSIYSKSANGFVNLGKAYVQLNKVDLSIQSIKKALELEPDNEEAKKLLDDLLKRIPENSHQE